MGQHKLEDKQAEAKDRQAEYNKLSVAQKIAKLDKKFGKNIGAVKERARLLKKKEAPKIIVKKDMAQKKDAPKNVKKK